MKSDLLKTFGAFFSVLGILYSEEFPISKYKIVSATGMYNGTVVNVLKSLREMGAVRAIRGKSNGREIILYEVAKDAFRVEENGAYLEFGRVK